MSSSKLFSDLIIEDFYTSSPLVKKTKPVIDQVYDPDLIVGKSIFYTCVNNNREMVNGKTDGYQSVIDRPFTVPVIMTFMHKVKGGDEYCEKVDDIHININTYNTDSTYKTFVIQKNIIRHLSVEEVSNLILRQPCSLKYFQTEIGEINEIEYKDVYTIIDNCLEESFVSSYLEDYESINDLYVLCSDTGYPERAIFEKAKNIFINEPSPAMRGINRFKNYTRAEYTHETYKGKELDLLYIGDVTNFGRNGSSELKIIDKILLKEPKNVVCIMTLDPKNNSMMMAKEIINSLRRREYVISSKVVNAQDCGCIKNKTYFILKAKKAP